MEIASSRVALLAMTPLFSDMVKIVASLWQSRACGAKPRSVLRLAVGESTYSDLPTVIFRRFFRVPLTRRYLPPAHSCAMLHERPDTSEIARAYCRSACGERAARGVGGERATIDHALVGR